MVTYQTSDNGFGYSAIGSRKENEDSICLFQQGDSYAVAILADGLGSHGGGRIASSIAVDTLKERLSQPVLPTKEQMEQAVQEANRRILAQQTDMVKMKTTLVVLVICGQQAVWTHIGDSRLYHFYNGELVDFTLDHSIPQVEVLQGTITREQMSSHPDRSRLYRALGVENVEAEWHSPISLASGEHAFLLCSDGFWERVLEMEIMLDLHKSENAEQWVNFLRLRGEKRKPHDVDNNSAIALLLKT